MGRRKISKPAVEKWADWLGRTIEGRLADIRNGEYGGLLDIRMADGVRTFSLTTKLAILKDVTRGTPIWVTYKGELVTKKGQLVRDFDIEVDDGEQAGEAKPQAASEVPAE